MFVYVDMDCFFSSCEIKREPKYAGKPVIVGATGKRGVVCAANYEARRWKVFSATPIVKAKELCKEGVFLPVDFKLYKNESRKVMQTLKEFGSVVQVSIDEAYIERVNCSAGQIQETVIKKTGLPCSVGVAPTQIVAKMASDVAKPGGIKIVEDIKAFLWPLPIETVPGIGEKSKPHYIRKGVRTIGDFLGLDYFVISEDFGRWGQMLWHKLQGLSYEQRAKRDHSIGHEQTFQKDVKNIEELKQALVRLCYAIGGRLKGASFKKVTVKIRWQDFSTITQTITLKTPFMSAEQLYSQAVILVKRKFNKPVRLIGVRVSCLQKPGQLILSDFL